MDTISIFTRVVFKDISVMESQVRSIAADGLVWGACMLLYKVGSK